MFAGLYARLGIAAAVALVVGALLLSLHVARLKIAALRGQLEACQMANKEYAASVAEQNKKIGDLIQETQELETQAAATASKDRIVTQERIRVVEKTIVPKACNQAIQWANSQANSLSSSFSH